MKKIVLTAAVIISIAGALFIYNLLITNLNNEFTEDQRDLARNSRKIYFMHWAYFPDEIFLRFNATHPEIIIDYEHINEQYYHDTQKLRINSGDKLDIMGVLRNDYDDFIVQGSLTDLSEKKYMDCYRPDAREELRRLPLSRKEYAVPYQSWVLGAWYNKALFNKYGLQTPRNYKEFLEVCRTFRDDGVTPLILGARDEWMRSYVYFLRLYALIEKDENWYARVKNGEKKWTDPEIAAVMKDVNDFLAEGNLGDSSLGLTYHQAFTEFLKGNSAMLITGDWAMSLAQSDVESIYELGVFPLPFNRQGEVSKVPGNKADMLTAVFDGSKSKDDADLFMEHLSRVDTAQIFSDANMSVSPVIGVDTSYLKYYDLWEPLRKMQRIPFSITEMDHEFLGCFNKKAGELILREKDYLQVLQEFQSFR